MEEIQIDRFNVTKLRAFVFYLDEIFVQIEFFMIDIGDDPNQKVYYYDVTLDYRRSGSDFRRTFIKRHNRIKKDIINVEMLNHLTILQNSLDNLKGLLDFEVTFYLIENVRMRMARTIYGSLEYFVYTDEENDTIKSEIDFTADYVRFNLNKQSLSSLIKVNTLINEYIKDSIKTN